MTDLNFAVFDRAARVTGSQFDDLSNGIEAELNAAQQRHQERLATLRQQYLDEQQQIIGGTSISDIAHARVARKKAETPDGIHPEAKARYERRQARKAGPPPFLALAALATIIVILIAS